MCPCEFPESIPWECVRSLISIVRAGDYSQWPTALRHAACLMGACANMAGAHDSGPFGATAGSRTMGDVLSELEGYVIDVENGGVQGVSESYLRHLIMQFVVLVLEFIKERNL